MQYGRVKDAAPYGGGVQKRPPSTTRDGVGTAALRHMPRGLRHLRMALGTMGDFAPCAAREFRPLRRATKGSAFGNRDFLKKIE